jgi:peptide/nickel transport system substrate-binding protein
MKRRELIKVGVAAMAAPSLSLAQQRKTLKFVPSADLVLLDPVQTPALVTRTHGMMVFDTLYGIDSQFRPHPQMVAGHEILDGGKTWVLTLRDGLRFHDGTPVLARDAKASVERWAKVDLMGKSMSARLLELSAPNDKTLKFRFKTPFPQLPYALSKISGICPIMPERLALTDPSVQVAEIIGSGPFRFVANERVPGARVVYERFASYVPRADGVTSMTSGPKVVHVDRVEWHTMPDPSTAAAALQSGEVDWWENPILDLAPVLRRNKNIQLKVLDPAGLMAMVRLNHLNPPFNNPDIRRALLAGIRQSDYMQAVSGEDRTFWRDGIGFFLPGSPSASDAGMAALTGPRDLDKVKRDLVAAGYKGERVVIMSASDSPTINGISEVAAHYLRRVGMNVDFQMMDWGTVLQRQPNKATVDKGGWSLMANATPGANTVLPTLHQNMRGLGAKGFYGWPTSEKHEALLDQYLVAMDPAEQARITRDMQQQAFQDLPYIPLGQMMMPAAFRSSLSGVMESFSQFHNVRKA